MLKTTPTLLWLRRDLRLADHRALSAACEDGSPVIPVFIHDETIDGLGAAPRFRLGLGLQHFAQQLEQKGSKLILRRGNALQVLQELVAETGAGRVYWLRYLAPDAIERDRKVKFSLQRQGLEARSFQGNLLHEPWDVSTGSGSYYKVYTPYWRAVRDLPVPPPRLAPAMIPAPRRWPASDQLSDWNMGAAMDRGAKVLARHMQVGEAAANAKLQQFIAGPVQNYSDDRNLPAQAATSGLSEYLTWGEISPGTVHAAGQRALHDGAAGAETFLKELTWREFSWHLLFHNDQMERQNWRPGWEDFPWRAEEDRPEVLAWKQGRTGVDFVDAGMRELYVTGRMHNRVRMIAASYLTKHLLVDWRVGLRWFADTLIDHDPAANAMGWQWVAGCGPDAAPYFRVFNPDTQAQKFDPDGSYRRRWLAPDSGFYQAIPRSWRLSPDDPRPAPLIGLAQGRERALAAYEQIKRAKV